MMRQDWNGPMNVDGQDDGYLGVVVFIGEDRTDVVDDRNVGFGMMMIPGDAIRYAQQGQAITRMAATAPHCYHRHPQPATTAPTAFFYQAPWPCIYTLLLADSQTSIFPTMLLFYQAGLRQCW